MESAQLVQFHISAGDFLGCSPTLFQWPLTKPAEHHSSRFPLCYNTDDVHLRTSIFWVFLPCIGLDLNEQKSFFNVSLNSSVRLQQKPVQEVTIKTLTVSPASAERRPHGTEPLEGAPVFTFIFCRLLV